VKIHTQLFNALHNFPRAIAEYAANALEKGKWKAVEIALNTSNVVTREAVKYNSLNPLQTNCDKSIHH
jgi:hypothetical protein